MKQVTITKAFMKHLKSLPSVKKDIADYKRGAAIVAAEAKAKKTKRVKLTDKQIRQHAEVVGTCKCGKPAQIMWMKNGKIIRQCFDCGN